MTHLLHAGIARFRATFAVLALAIVPVANAQPAVTGFTGGTHFSSFYGSYQGDVVGFRFTAFEDVSVSHLGIYSPGGTLWNSHQVGLWRSNDRTLLASVTVNPGSMLLNDIWRFESIGTPVLLSSGHDYVLGALYIHGSGDDYVSNPWTLELDPRIGNTNGVFPSYGDQGFVFPENNSSNLARLGPNMILAPNVVVPEPSTYLLMASGLMALGVAHRRRRTAA